jgi:hypothetical protein
LEPLRFFFQVQPPLTFGANGHGSANGGAKPTAASARAGGRPEEID